MDIRTKEAVRYLGYGRHAVDSRTFELIQDSFEELEYNSDARFIYRIFEISEITPGSIKIENMTIHSRDLYKNLKGCRQVALFAATLGLHVDRMIKKETITDVSKAVVMQACAAALLEEFCDQSVEELKKDLGDGLYLRPRFSAGYGDFSIMHQKELLELLDASRRIGLTLTEASMLIPVKSVTAVIGISRHDDCSNPKGCELCQKTECMYRRS